MHGLHFKQGKLVARESTEEEKAEIEASKVVSNCGENTNVWSWYLGLFCCCARPCELLYLEYGPVYVAAN